MVVDFVGVFKYLVKLFIGVLYKEVDLDDESYFDFKDNIVLSLFLL